MKLNRFALVFDRVGRTIEPDILNAVLAGMREGAWQYSEVQISGSLVGVEVSTAPLERSKERTCTVMADARIDDRVSLVRELRTAGVALQQDASAEQSIVAAYQAWGTDATKHLRGDFSFILWDPDKKLLLAARDHFGVRSLYYAEIGERLIVTNTLRAILSLPGMDRTFDDCSVCDFLMFGFSLDTSATIYVEAKRVPPAHTLVFEGHGSVRIKRYWQLPVEKPLRFRRESDYIEGFRERMEGAVTDRLGDGRVGVSLSGGIDSSAVLAVSHDILRRRCVAFDLRAWTVDSPILWPEGKEGQLASVVSNHLGVPLDSARPEDFPVFFETDPAFHVPSEPLYSPQHGIFLRQFRSIAAHASTALTGNGSDPGLEPACGYMWQLLRKGHLLRFLLDGFRYARRRGRLPPLCLRTTLTRSLLHKSPERPVFPLWLQPEIVERLDLRGRWDGYTDGIFSPDSALNPFRPEAHAALASPHWPFVFWSYSPEVSGVPLELAHPFFDLRVATFLLRLPSVPWCTDKWILREIMQGHLPEVVRARLKHTPRSDTMNKVLKTDRGSLPKASLVLQQEKFLLEKYFKPNTVLSMVEQRRKLRSSELGLIGRPLAIAAWINANRMDFND